MIATLKYPFSSKSKGVTVSCSRRYMLQSLLDALCRLVTSQNRVFLIGKPPVNKHAMVIKGLLTEKPKDEGFNGVTHYSFSLRIALSEDGLQSFILMLRNLKSMTAVQFDHIHLSKWKCKNIVFSAYCMTGGLIM